MPAALRSRSRSPRGGSKGRGLGELARCFADKLNFDPPEITEGLQASVAARDALAPEIPELRTSLSQLRQRISSLRTAADTVTRHVATDAKAGENPTGSAAYMDMKAQMLLNYTVGLTYYLLLKVRGTPVRDHPVTLKLMWLRTLLEKLRPIDQRLQYQMNKLLQAAEAKVADDEATADLKSLRPGELAATVEDEEGDAEEAEAMPQMDEEDDGIYRPPKIAQVEYTGDHVTGKRRAERDLERQKQRLERSDLVRSMREEFTDAPVEFRGEERSAAVERAERKIREQEQYEEDNMVRLRASKVEKREKRRLFQSKRSVSGGAVSLQDAADLNDISAMMTNSGRGGKGKGKKGKGKGRGRGQKNPIDMLMQ